MLVIDNGDAIRGDATVASGIDFVINGYVDTVATQLADGQLPNSEDDLYSSGANATVVLSIVLVNIDTSTRTCNLYLKPSGGTSRRVIPKDCSLAAGYSLHTDGVTISVLDTSGQIMDSYGAHATSHENGGADEITVSGLSGLLADEQDPLAHSGDHENGGGDEIGVGGLSGLLADDQHVLDTEVKAIKLDDFTTPDDNTDLDASAAKHGLMPKNDKIKIDTVATNADVTGSNPPQSHAASHQNGGGDEVSVSGLSGLLADEQNPLAHASEHTDGTDDIQDAVANGSTKGIAAFTAADFDAAAGVISIAADVIRDALFNAYTMLYADTDNTPAALTISASRIVGRKAAGGIAAMTGAEVLAILNGQLGASFSFNSKNITSVGGITLVQTTKILTTGSNSYFSMRGSSDSGGGGCYVALYGKTEGTHPGSFLINTPNAAGNADVQRLKISGVLDVAVLALTNITVTGLKLSGALDVNSQVINNVTEIHSANANLDLYGERTTGGGNAIQIWTRKADGSDRLRWLISGTIDIASMRYEYCNVNFKPDGTNSRLLIGDASITWSASATHLNLTLGGTLDANSQAITNLAQAIADGNILTVDQADAANGEYARFTASGLESRSATEVRGDINVADGADVTGSNAPQSHSASHQNGGGDEITVSGLSGLLADDQHVLDAEVISAVKGDASLPVATITFIIDGGGAEIATGLHGDLEIPFPCTINRVTMIADQSGSIIVDIWKQAYADYPPEDAQSITSSSPPTISGADKSQDSTLSGWTTTTAAGDTLRFNVDSVTSIERVTTSLKVIKT